MTFELQSQVKGIISAVLTIIIAVSSGFVIQNPWFWIAIAICGFAQVSLICIPSIEERFYRDRMAYMERQDKRDRDFEEKTKKLRLSKKLQNMQDQAKKIENGKGLRNFIEFDKYNRHSWGRK